MCGEDNMKQLWFDRLGGRVMFGLDLPANLTSEAQIEQFVKEYAEVMIQAKWEKQQISAEYNEITNEGKVWLPLVCVGIFYVKEKV
jgi:hypothetical protein